MALLAGCNGQLFNGINLGGLQFTPSTQERLRQFSGSSQAKTGDAATPTAAPMAMAPGMSVSEGMVARSYPVWGGGMGNFTLVSTEEAKSAGMTGGFSEVESQIRPLVQAWAADAKLTSVWGNDGGSPENGSTPGWNLSYWSPSLLQSLNLYVTDKETLIFKQTWKTVALDTTGIIDSAKVKSLVTAAITDPSFKPPVEQVSAEIKPMPAIAPTQTDMPAPPSDYQPPQETELFEIPANASWHYNLYMENDKLVWTVNIDSYTAVMYAKPMAEPAAATSGGSAGSGTVTSPETSVVQPDYYLAGGWARLDAKTGEILALTRPRKISTTTVGQTEPTRAVASPAQ